MRRVVNRRRRDAPGRHPAAKLTEVDVLLIRLLADLGLSPEWVGQTFGISASHVTQIGLRQSWKSVA